jgi:hypothetical protein
MARGHIFLIVLVLAAALVAAVLAVSRTTQSSSAASTSPAISFRLRKLDRLEASLERRLARQRATTTTPTAPAIVYQRAAAPVSTVRHGDDGAEAYGHERGGERDD